MYVSPIANDILAGHLINYGAVSFMTDSPMRLKSGLVTPIYVDNRSLTICIFIICYGRMIEIYCVTSIAPIPMATMANREWGQRGQNYL